MVEDTKMTEGEEPKAEEESKEETPPPPVPPLEAAAQRLERLLGGGLSDKDRMLDFYTNPVKVVRRWLGTSSGAAGDASAEDIKAAAAKLLDPAGPCAAGRQLLLSAGQEESEPTYLSLSSAREVESWLLSLAVRLLWRDNKHAEAFELSQKAIQIMMHHLEGKSLSSDASLFPLLARMYRLRALVVSSDTSLRADMAKAHNMASLRRDVDTQATLLNCMLRDLLKCSQSKFLNYRYCYYILHVRM